MEAFDGVDLPFFNEAQPGSSTQHVRHLALARSLVLAELQSDESAAAAWKEAEAACCREQESNAARYRAFVSEMVQQSPSNMLSSSSPISGAARLVGGSRRAGLLDDVSVAAPPVVLRGVARRVENPVRGDASNKASDDALLDSEAPLLQSSSFLSQGSGPGDSSLWTPQHVASQSSLDGIFFESLVSQQLSLDLWIEAANPQEILQGMLEDVRRIDQALCAEATALEAVNAARFSEQRDFKRRRATLKSQAAKVRAKVASLEVLLKVDEGESKGVPQRVRLADRLCLSLLD